MGPFRRWREPLPDAVRPRGLGRAAVDAAVAALDIHELPGARGCTYVVPARDFALALKVGQAFGGGEMNLARKLGVTDKDVDKLCEKVLAALAKGPLDPEALKAAAGSAVKNLGEAGKKKGLTSTLPVALGRLQQSGAHPARAHRRPPRPAALPVCVVEDEPAREVQGDGRRGVRRAGEALLHVDWARPHAPTSSGSPVSASRPRRPPSSPSASCRSRPAASSSSLPGDLDAFKRAKAAGQAPVRAGWVDRRHQPAEARPAEPGRRRRHEADRDRGARRPRVRRAERLAQPRHSRSRPRRRPLGIRSRRAADRVVGVRREPEGQGARRCGRTDRGLHRRAISATRAPSASTARRAARPASRRCAGRPGTASAEARGWLCP